MPLDKLESWLQARVEKHPVATSLPMLDSYVAAIVARPVSMSPLDWICLLLPSTLTHPNHDGSSQAAMNWPFRMGMLRSALRLTLCG